MENTTQPPPPGVGVRREPSIDPVKAQGILASVTKKERNAARQWEQRWGFMCKLCEVQEEEARKLGMSLEALYKAAACSVNIKPEQNLHHIHIEPSTTKLPQTTSGMIGRRVQYSLERYGKLVRTSRDHPAQPPLAPGQIYDPYKQTMLFLGSVEGDPISHKQSPARCEVTEDIWAQPQQLGITFFKFNEL